MSALNPAEPLPNNRAWPFRLAVGGWLLAGILGVWLLPDVGLAGNVVLGGLWLAGLGVLLREFITSLFGPVLAYDLLRMGRRKRTFWTRGLYAVAMAIIFTWMYVLWYYTATRYGPLAHPREMAKLAETFFTAYMVVQFVLVCLLTPGGVASSITDEKERRTIEFMLATDLRDREILFGKFASRVGSLLLFLMAGLPILSLVQFFGGIDPDQVMAGFAATFITVISLSGMAMAASVLSRKSRDAIALTYLFAIAYCCFSGVAMGLGMAATRAGEMITIGSRVIGWDDVAYPFVCGNPFYMVPNLLSRRGGTTPSVLLNGTLHYLIFHMVVFALFMGWSGLRLRSIALAQTFGGGPKKRSLGQRLTGGKSISIKAASASMRPDMGNSPILWKEIFIESGFKMGLFAKIILTMLVLASFAPVLVIAVSVLVLDNSWRYGGPWWGIGRWKEFSEATNAYVRVLSPVVSSMIFLAIAIRGAGTILGERDRHSLDVLLTTPLPTGKILWGKWWGCLLGMRWAWAWLGSIWLIGLATGGVAPIMLPALAISAAVYAAGFAWIGIFCSVTMKSALRATMAAIAISMFAGGGYFLGFLFCCILPLELGGGRLGGGRDMDIIVDFFSGFSPPVNMAWLPIHEFADWETSLSHRDIPYAPFWILGLLAWGGLAVAISSSSLARFHKLANRLPMTNRRPLTGFQSDTSGQSRPLDDD
ncbi:ABC transporter permease [Zavarzinella formosa]|uniref:ABC transporter permease n=1 Tax=Zavarzinella formosa TaxID=360055 RepID=UPI00030B674B|nr:ABC transporter permease subunit [Zavarzinella formosa]